uniref:Transmembrane protein n=1 Tax=Nelumbo nucifera TaxID=4432 RepID=A0A822XTA8_NELNU|nr:TPA_asm: hypothetical protein HUJ06_022141 [Nelumbo nucifera]
MSRFLLVCFVMTELLMVLAMAHENQHLESRAPEAETEVEHQKSVVGSSDPPVSSAAAPSSEDEGESTEVAEAPGIRRMGKHHSSGGSAAGGGVIIGGIATAIFAVVFAYIRVTRRRNADVKS